MIKQGIINYLKNLKYFFTPLGTLALGLIFGLSILIPGVMNSLSTLSESIQTILSDTSIDFPVFKDSVIEAVQALDWSDPIGAINTMFNNNWLLNTLESCAGTYLGNTDAYVVDFQSAIESFASDITLYLLVVIFFLVVGFIGGFFLTKWLIRRNIAKRSLRKYLLNALIDIVFSIILITLCIWLMVIWRPSAFISTLFSIFVFGFISLLEAYMIHGRKKVERKQIVNGKNMIKLYVTDLIIFIISAIFVSISIALTNEIVGIFIGIVLMELAFIVISLNAESYVKSAVEVDESK